jgi:tetratricopeptide (TPR) repeat protein
MNRIYLVLFCLVLNSCGSSSVSKPTVLLNVENYSDDGLQAYAEEDWIRARRLFNRALSLNQSIDDRLGTLTSHINLVEVALALHDDLAAHRHLTLATDIVKTDALKSYQTRITLLHALVARRENQTDKAIHFLDDLLPEFEKENTATTPDAIQLATIAIRTEIAFGKMQNQSLWTLRYGNALKKSANQNTALEARLLRFQSKLLLQQDGHAESAANLRQALMIYKKNLSRSGIAATLLELGMIYEKQSDWQRALNYFKRSVAVFRALGNNEKINKVTAMLAKAESEIAKSDLRTNEYKLNR